MQCAQRSLQLSIRIARLPIADGFVCNFNVLVIALLMCINCHLISRPVCVVCSGLAGRLFICFPFSCNAYFFFQSILFSHSFSYACQVPNSKESFNYLSNYGNLRWRRHPKAKSEMRKAKLICRRFIILMTGINYLRYIMSNLFNLLPAAMAKQPQHQYQHQHKHQRQSSIDNRQSTSNIMKTDRHFVLPSVCLFCLRLANCIMKMSINFPTICRQTGVYVCHIVLPPSSHTHTHTHTHTQLPVTLNANCKLSSSAGGKY